MVNYFNFKQNGKSFLITNDTGRYAFVDPSCFKKLMNGNIQSSDENFQRLKSDFFVTDEHPETFIREICGYVRELKNYTLTGTALHIFAVTNACNMNCIYCQAKDIKTKKVGFMNKELAEKAIDIASSSPAKFLTFEFQGGEPLLNFDIVKHMIKYSQAINKNKHVEYTIVSNLVLLDEEILDFLIENNVSICTSIDGHALVQNHNRPLVEGGDSFRYIKRGIELIKSRDKSVGAIETTSRFSLDYPKEIIDTYVELGINEIFIRPLTPLGFAKTYWEQIGYSAEEYIAFYKKALAYIIEINKSGRYFCESHAGYFLKKILGGYSDNYMELRSPCGATIGQMSYYYDGSIYTCDEGRMLSETGDNAFKIGDVSSSTYDDLLNSPACKATCSASVLESLPSCCDCAYQPYCGVCPVVTYAEQKDIFSKMPKDYRCKVYSGMLDILFKIIENGDKTEMDILRSWI